MGEGHWAAEDCSPPVHSPCLMQTQLFPHKTAQIFPSRNVGGQSLPYNREEEKSEELLEKTPSIFKKYFPNPHAKP